jgi:GGDEF domain-containing protein
MMITRRFEQPHCSRLATGDARTAMHQRHLIPAARFEEMLVRALAAAAPERTPLPSPPGGPAVFYVDVDRFALAAAGLTGDAIESALAETGRRLVSWAGRNGAATRRGDDHFVLLRYRQHDAADEGQVDACDRAAADLCRHLQRPILVAGRRVRVACSVGVVNAARVAEGSGASATSFC